MSCNHCSTKFNFFHKEMGCSNCGLSLCSKCLKQKCKIPSKGSGEYNVCRLCFAKLTSGATNTQPQVIFPPDKFLKRLENLENPSAPPIIMYKQDSKILALRTGLSPADQELVDRLEKLKDDGKGPPPSETEIRKRLANLKGESIVEGSSKPLFLPDSRTDQQKIDSLLEQYSKEQEIEQTHNPLEGIEARLATLKDQTVKNNEERDNSNASDSEQEVDRITKKIREEVALDDSAPIKLTSKNSLSSTTEDLDRTSPELPWCVLCNEDAKYRCLDCSGDLYCSACNREVHKTWGETHHKVVPYKPNKSA